MIEHRSQESGYRWVNLTLFFLASLVNSLPNQTFSSINTIVSKNFGIDPVVITLNVLIFSILNPIFAFPTNWILDRFGMKIGCSMGGSLVIVGVWLRIFIKQGDIGLCMFGSVLASIGSIAIVNSPSTLATNWFKASSVPAAISVCSCRPTFSSIGEWASWVSGQGNSG